jgi:translation initiation factor IF-3
MSHQEMGYDVIKKAIEYVKDLCLVEAQPKTEGKNMFAMIAPDPAKIKDYLKANPPKNTKEILPELSKDDLSSTSHTEEHDE